MYITNIFNAVIETIILKYGEGQQEQYESTIRGCSSEILYRR